jgi:hypothetical protein
MLRSKLIDWDRILPAATVGCVVGNGMLIFGILMSGGTPIGPAAMMMGGLFMFVFAIIVSTIPILVATIVCGIIVDRVIGFDQARDRAKKYILYSCILAIPFCIVAGQPGLMIVCAYMLPAVFVYLKPLRIR